MILMTVKMTNGNGNLVHLHTHTAQGSLLDSILKVEDMVQFAKNNNQNAIALTDHGNMQSYVNFWKECTKQGIKPIIGSEIYEVESLEKAMLIKNSTEKNKEKLQRFHLVLLAKNKIGFKNLLKISSDSHTKFFYTKPLIDLQYIKQNNLGKGLICLTACQAGRLSKMVTGEYNSSTSAKEYYSELESTFENVYVEIQSHNTESQHLANRKLLSFAKNENKPYTITCDCHMLEKDDIAAHDMFIYLAKDYEVGETYNGCYMQTNKNVYQELKNNISKEDIQIGINESFFISEMVEKYDIGVGQEDQMPIVKVPSNFKNKDEWYNHLIEKGFKEKGHDKLSKEERKERKERLRNEKEVLEYLGYIDYFLMLYILINRYRDEGIPLNYSRGSGGNCLSLYYLNVTQIDSYRWELDFSRFGNKGRKGSSADYDIDISKKRRQEGVEIMRQMFGRQNVAPICTFNSFSTKVAIRDIGKVLDEKGIYNIPYSIRDEVAKAIPAIKTLNDLGEEEEKEVLLQEFLSQSSTLKKYYDMYPLWFKYVMKLEGLPKSRGKHAGGVLITPKPLVEYCPLCLDKDGEPMAQLEMHNAMDDLGLVKMDLLGLKTLDVVDDTLKFIGKTWDDFDIDHLDLKDKNVYKEIYAKGNTANVFQFESYECIDMCKSADTDNIEDIIAINAFNRPGTKAQFPSYVKNKKDPEHATILHEDLTEIFKMTHGVLLYQEQVLKILGLAGLNESDQDKGRRAMGKKDEEKMLMLKPQIVDGFKVIGWNDDKITELWDLLMEQSKYNFNRGHATAYSLLSYLTAYLKHYYPVEFMTACLNNENNYGKVSKIITEVKAMNITLTPPKINKSQEYFTPNAQQKEILFGVYPIKNVGEKAGSEIIQGYPFERFVDFSNKIFVKGSKVNSKAMVSLIKSGFFGNDKNKYFKKYFNYRFRQDNLNKINKEFKPYKTTSKYNLKELKAQFGIEEKDKEIRLKKYNLTMAKKFEEDKKIMLEELKIERKDKVKEFQQKYMKNKDMWEFETLSMFVSNNPLEKTRHYLKKEFKDYKVGNKAICVGAICKIDKKGSGSKQNAFVEFYTTNGVVEAIFWSNIYTKFQKYIERGECLVLRGRKDADNKITVSDLKLYNQWVAQMERKYVNANKK